MLKKLFKYDWKSVSLLLFILHGILLFYTLIGRIGISIAMSQSASHVITEDSARIPDTHTARISGKTAFF